MSEPFAQRKAAIRACALARRDALTAEARADKSAAIGRGLLAHPAFARARVVMAYCSFGTELDTSGLLDAVRAQRKVLVLPRIDRRANALQVFAVDDPRTQLVANGWGIREPRPDACQPVRLAEIEWVLAPGVAFDATGGRLGYGKGYYDRLFHACKSAGGAPFIVAGAFDAQLVEAVPMTAHDVAVHHIVTETRSISTVPAQRG